jgi:hypothetical protein
MVERKEPERFPITIPLVPEPDFVLIGEPEEVEWDLVPSKVEEYDDEHEPELETKLVGQPPKIPTRTGWPPSHPLPDYPGRLPGYVSFRYFDDSKVDYKVVRGRPIPRDANIWGVLIPEEYLSATAQAIKMIGSGTKSLKVVRHRQAPWKISAVEREVALSIIFAFHQPLFLLDRACKILESVIQTNFNPRGLLIQNIDVVRADVIALCCHHAMNHSVSQAKAKSYVDLYKKVGWKTDLTSSIGQTYTRVLTGLLTGVNHVEPKTGLNFLIGSDIPDMKEYDYYFKFPSEPKELRWHIV